MRIFRSILILFVIFFLVSCGEKKQSNDSEVSVREDNVEETAMPEVPPQIITYVVRLKDTELSLYEVDGEVEHCIKTITIDTSYYPLEDIDELNRGVSAYSKEEGFEILENFVN